MGRAPLLFIFDGDVSTETNNYNWSGGFIEKDDFFTASNVKLTLHFVNEFFHFQPIYLPKF